MARRPVKAGLFHGWWYTADGKKIRRIHRHEYPELYSLVGKHADIASSPDPVRLGRRIAAQQLGITPLGTIPVLRDAA